MSKTWTPARVLGAFALAAIVVTAAVLGFRKASHRPSPPSPVTATPTPDPEVQAAIEQFNQLYEAKEFDKAITFARLMLEKRPRAPFLHFCVGTAYGAKQDYPAAIQEFKLEIQNNPGFEKSYGRIAFALIQLNQFEAALPYFEKAREVNPKNPQVLFSLGQLLIRLGRADEGEKYVREAASIDLIDPELHYESALIHLKAGRMEETIAELRRVLSIDGRHQGAMYNLGQSLIRVGRKEEAKTILDRHDVLAKQAVEIDGWARLADGKQARAVDFANLADAYARYEDCTRAIPHYRRAIQMDPAQVRYVLAEGMCELELGHLDAAERLALRAQVLAPQNDSSPFLLGLIRIRQDHPDLALPLLERSRSGGKWSAATYEILGRTYLDARRFSEALAALDQAVELEPGNTKARYLKGRALAGLDRLEPARKELELALQADPNQEDYYMAIAITDFRRGDTAGAEAAFREAIRLQESTVFGPEGVKRVVARFSDTAASAPALQQYVTLWAQLDASQAAATSPTATRTK